MAEENEPVVRVRPWWRLFWITAGLGSITVVALVFWYHSTADLAAVRELAKQQGVATTWNEFRPGFTPDATLIAQFNRLALLSGKLKDYDSQLSLGKIAGDLKRDRLRPFWPVPAAARAFHAQQDPAVVAEALAILDAWPARRLVLSDANPKNRVKEKNSLYLQMTRWLRERVLLADDEHAFTEVRRLLHLLVQFDVKTSFDCLTEASLIHSVAQIVAEQLPRLTHHADEIAALLTQLDDRLVADLRTGLAGSFVELLLLFEKPGNGRELGLSLFSESASWDSYLGPLRVRAGRASVLAIELERDRQLSAHGLGYEHVRWITEAKQRCEALSNWRPDHWLPKVFGSFGQIIDESVLICRMQLRVLLAEIRGEPWPTDLFDPTGQPLRRLTRDGQMIGAYSFGTDKKDDGGDRRKDRQFLLYGAWELPPPVAEP